MDIKTRTLEELAEKSNTITSKTAVVGLDGFVDKIVHPVDQRHGQGDNFTAIETIAEFGNRISAAAGKSANIELYPIMEKLGGNGPIMAHALLTAGTKTRYIGALGKPVQSVFHEFAEKTDAVTVCEPGITTAAEFKDGKIMLGNTASLDHLTYSALVKEMGEGKFIDCLDKADLVALVNWTMIPNMTAIFNDLVDKVFSNLGPRDQRLFFFDLADPAKRSAEDLRGAMKSIQRFQSYGAVTLGLNFSEAQQIYTVLGLEPLEPNEEGLKKMAARIREEMELSCVAVHPVDSAACATKEGAFWVKGPFCDAPKITTGAGDHFNGGFMTGQLLGLSPESCLSVAVSFSGSYVRTAKSPTLSDVSEFIKTVWE